MPGAATRVHAHARGHAPCATGCSPRRRRNRRREPRPRCTPKRSFLDGVSAYYEDDQDVSHGDDAEMVGLPLDDFVYDVYAYDATADVEPRRVSTSRDHDGAQSRPTPVEDGGLRVARVPGDDARGDTLSSSGESEDDDGLSTRCGIT